MSLVLRDPPKLLNIHYALTSTRLPAGLQMKQPAMVGGCGGARAHSKAQGLVSDERRNTVLLSQEGRAGRMGRLRYLWFTMHQDILRVSK